MRFYLAILTALLVAAGSLVGAPPSHAQAKADIVIGMQCDRTGATQIVGTVLCPGFHDYIALINSKGGVEGHKIKALEIDHEYKVPPGVESYERHKKEGAVTIAVYGTPHIYALAAKLTEDRIPGTSPGFGSAAAADGIRYPYIFPIAATYWSQATAAVDFVKKHLFGGAPAVSIKEFKRVGYPLRKFVSFVWGSAEANIDAAGGFAVAEGYYTMQFAGVGSDYPVLNEIRDMYKKEGKPARRSRSRPRITRVAVSSRSGR
ncbi:MAG: hypothetical protein DME16_22510 [Candidatus Rokuibacteriota bacterium]|nr:MAG: hypothetical protein DME16_22510 [Candidatus Rokubacteria bacterium]